MVSVSGEGEVRVNNEAVALAEAGQAVRQRMPDEVPAGAAQVRLSVPRGAHVDALGRLLAKLAEAEVTNVVFVPPEEARAARGAEAQGDGRGGGRFDRGAAVEVLVHDGGGEVTVGGMQMALANFVTAARSAVEREPNNPGGGGGMPAGQQSVSVRAATGAIDIRPIDIAAVHALLHVLGHEVTADYPVVAGSGEPGPGLDELRARWEREVLPQGAALRQAAATHYEVMEAYQQEINRLLDQADRLRREMDDLQARYNDLTTPKPTTAE